MSTLASPRPDDAGRSPLAWRALRFWCHRFAKTWRAQVGMTVFYPLLYLAAIGVGLGSLIDHHLGGATRTLGGVPYLTFVAPGLLAASAMQIAVVNSTWPVYGAIRWDHTYESQLATPLGVHDVLAGHLAFVAARLVLAGSLFLAVIAGFGAASSPEAVLALPASVLTGLAFATPLFALTARLKTEGRVRADPASDHRPAVPLLRHLLPGEPAAGLAAGCRGCHAALPRRVVVPCRDARPARPAEHDRPHRLPRGARNRRAAGGEADLPAPPRDVRPDQAPRR